MELIRISIGDLVEACRVLGEVRVMAAGSIYATLLCDDDMRGIITRAKISWCFDK